jgi:hypothetical protein
MEIEGTVTGQRRPIPCDWGVVITDETGSRVNRFVEPGMEEKIEALKKNWESRTPDSEESIVISAGTLVYVGRYPQGVVLKLNDDPEHVTFLTTEMAVKLSQVLGQDK